MLSIPKFEKKVAIVYYIIIIKQVSKDPLKKFEGVDRLQTHETECLLSNIECLRKKMIKVVSMKGYTSDESILISRELDALLNKYTKVVTNK